MQKQPSEELLLEFARTVELRATKVLEGMQVSPRSGGGIEFHSTSPYVGGEEARFIDWKRYASTDRLFVRKYEQQLRTGFAVAIDSSESMAYGKKRMWAENFVGALLFVARALGDSWQLLGSDAAHLEEVYQELRNPRHATSFEHLRDFSLRFGDRVVLVSDFFFDPALLRPFVRECQESGHLMAFVQVVDERERNFNFRGVYEFRDLEGSSKLLLDGDMARSLYLQEWKKLEEEWQDLLHPGDLWFSYSAHDDNLEQSLLDFFDRLAEV